MLLAFVVEQALLGNAGELKERTIGVEAFGREPDYDVALDPVVRMTAAEVRKRLSQYYYNPEHAGELAIELPVGSYAPSFREPAAQPAVAAAAIADALPAEAPARETASSDPGPAPAGAQDAPSRAAVFRPLSAAVALLFAAVLGFGVGRIKLPVPPSNLQRFWDPVTGTSSKVTYCLGEPVESVDQNYKVSEDLRQLSSLNVSDVTTLARVLVPLVSRKGSFRVVAASQSSFAQLREGPVVLIGAFDNPWTLRITEDLPIGFEYDNHVRKIVDRKGAQKRVWTLPGGTLPDSHLEQDYAVVARIHDNVTGEPVIVLAGIWADGTEAASEVVSNPVYLDALLEKVPKNWERMNLEAVIETRPIEGQAGPPTVVAVETW
ncbi:MAG: hypothetical protein WCE75_09295 [Terracidiphilus sp.]